MPPEIELEQHHNGIKILLIILGILIITGGVYLYVSKSTEPALEQKVDTSDWQMYRNEDFGFEFIYPISWTDDEHSYGLDVFQVKSEDGKYNFFAYNANGPGVPNPITEPECFEEINKVTYNDITWTIYNERCGEGGSAITAFVFRGELIYRILFEPENDRDATPEKLDQILSTFKFFEPIPKDWQTYRNEKYGFEIRYPRNSELGGSISNAPKDYYFRYPASNKDSIVVIHDKNFSVRVEAYDGTVEWYDVHATDNSQTFTGNTTFNGYRAKKVEHCEPGGCVDQIAIEKGSITYKINVGDSQLENQILSTFKFIAPMDQVDSWNSTSTAMGWTFGYPIGWQVKPTAPLSDPTGSLGLTISNPADEYPSQGIGITVDSNTTVEEVINSMSEIILLDTYTTLLNGRNWNVLILENSNTQLEIIVALTQAGPDVVRVGGLYSEQNLDIITGIITSLR